MDQSFLEKALSLPIEDRAELAEQLWRSLEGVELDPPWDDEIVARIEQIERGECQGVDWREALAQSRKRLTDKGAS